MPWNGASSTSWRLSAHRLPVRTAASPAWEFYGKKGLPSANLPKMETLEDSGSVAFRQHLYGHTPNPNWSYFITFAEKEFAKQK